MKLINSFGEATKYTNEQIYSLFSNSDCVNIISMDSQNRQIDLISNGLKYTIISPTKLVIDWLKRWNL